jgi:hypothetical protein
VEVTYVTAFAFKKLGLVTVTNPSNIHTGPPKMEPRLKESEIIEFNDVNWFVALTSNAFPVLSVENCINLPAL